MGVSFHNKDILQFWDEIVVRLPEGGFRKAAFLILSQLDLKGHCPSVRTPIRTPLQSITLTDHTLRVARNIHGVGIPGTPLYNCAIISALGHDIAKIPGILPKNHFAKILHARKGADYLESRLYGILKEQEIELIRETVYHHHDHEKKTSSIKQLKEADHEARKTESDLLGIQMIENGVDPEIGVFVPLRETERNKESYIVNSEKISTDPDAEKVPWFSVPEFLKALAPKVNNQVFFTWGPEAIGMGNDVCYFTPDVIYNTFKELAVEKKWAPIELIDNTAVNPQRRRNLVAFIGKRLREAGALATHILPPSPKYYMGQYLVTFKGLPSRRVWYVPILGRHIANLMVLQKRKDNSAFSLVRAISKFNGKWGAEI